MTSRTRIVTWILFTVLLTPLTAFSVNTIYSELECAQIEAFQQQWIQNGKRSQDLGSYIASLTATHRIGTSIGSNLSCGLSTSETTAHSIALNTAAGEMDPNKASFWSRAMTGCNAVKNALNSCALLSGKWEKIRGRYTTVGAFQAAAEDPQLRTQLITFLNETTTPPPPPGGGETPPPRRVVDAPQLNSGDVPQAHRDAVARVRTLATEAMSEFAARDSYQANCTEAKADAYKYGESATRQSQEFNRLQGQIIDEQDRARFHEDTGRHRQWAETASEADREAECIARNDRLRLLANNGPDVKTDCGLLAIDIFGFGYALSAVKQDGERVLMNKPADPPSAWHAHLLLHGIWGMFNPGGRVEQCQYRERKLFEWRRTEPELQEYCDKFAQLEVDVRAAVKSASVGKCLSNMYYGGRYRFSLSSDDAAFKESQKQYCQNRLNNGEKAKVQNRKQDLLLRAAMCLGDHRNDKLVKPSVNCNAAEVPGVVCNTPNPEQNMLNATSVELAEKSSLNLDFPAVTGPTPNDIAGTDACFMFGKKVRLDLAQKLNTVCLSRRGDGSCVQQDDASFARSCFHYYQKEVSPNLFPAEFAENPDKAINSLRLWCKDKASEEQRNKYLTHVDSIVSMCTGFITNRMFRGYKTNTSTSGAPSNGEVQTAQLNEAIRFHSPLLQVESDENIPDPPVVSVDPSLGPVYVTNVPCPNETGSCGTGSCLAGQPDQNTIKIFRSGEFNPIATISCNTSAAPPTFSYSTTGSNLTCNCPMQSAVAGGGGGGGGGTTPVGSWQPRSELVLTNGTQNPSAYTYDEDAGKPRTAVHDTAGNRIVVYAYLPERSGNWYQSLPSNGSGKFKVDNPTDASVTIQTSRSCDSITSSNPLQLRPGVALTSCTGISGTDRSTASAN